MSKTRLHSSLIPICAIAATGLAWLLLAQSTRPDQAQLWHYRNLGKAFYENPTTQLQAVEEFRTKIREGCERNNVHYMLVNTGHALHEVISGYLAFRLKTHTR